MSIAKCQLLKKRGFTLIELIIVIAIIMIMTTVSLVMMQGNRKTKELDAAAREVAAAIRETQNYALSGKQVNASDYPCQFTFRKDAIATSYYIQYTSHSLGNSSCGALTSYITYNVNNGVEIRAVTDFNATGGVSSCNYSRYSFNFSVPFGGVTVDFTNTTLPCTNFSGSLVPSIRAPAIRVCKGTASTANCYVVCVTSTGNVCVRPNAINCSATLALPCSP